MSTQAKLLIANLQRMGFVLDNSIRIFGVVDFRLKSGNHTGCWVEPGHKGWFWNSKEGGKYSVNSGNHEHRCFKVFAKVEGGLAYRKIDQDYVPDLTGDGTTL